MKIYQIFMFLIHLNLNLEEGRGISIGFLTMRSIFWTDLFIYLFLKTFLVDILRLIKSNDKDIKTSGKFLANEQVTFKCKNKSDYTCVF